MTITVDTADPRSVKALAVLATSDRWQKGHTKDGRSFYAVPSETEAGLLHLADTRECSCYDFRSRGLACKHVLAVRLKVAQLQATDARKPRRKPAPTGVGVATGTTRELRLQGAADDGSCSTCGKAHSSEANRQAIHAALADAIWGTDGD